jgi:hypothetical protein
VNPSRIAHLLAAAVRPLAVSLLAYAAELNTVQPAKALPDQRLLGHPVSGAAAATA